MAANGFIELLRLAKRGNRSYAASNNEVNRWSGIAFEMLGQYFVAPLGSLILSLGSVDWLIFGEDYFVWLTWHSLYLDNAAISHLLKKYSALVIMNNMWVW